MFEQLFWELPPLQIFSFKSQLKLLKSSSTLSFFFLEYGVSEDGEEEEAAGFGKEIKDEQQACGLL